MGDSKSLAIVLNEQTIESQRKIVTLCSDMGKKSCGDNPMKP
jgi:hypothetical protein